MGTGTNFKATGTTKYTEKVTLQLRYSGLFARLLFQNRQLIDFERVNAPGTSGLAAFSRVSSFKIDEWSILKE